jgi:hypothetical protein
MTVDNTNFEEEQVQSFEVKESTLSLEKGVWLYWWPYPKGTQGLGVVGV